MKIMDFLRRKTCDSIQFCNALYYAFGTNDLNDGLKIVQNKLLQDFHETHFVWCFETEILKDEWHIKLNFLKTQDIFKPWY